MIRPFPAIALVCALLAGAFYSPVAAQQRALQLGEVKIRFHTIAGKTNNKSLETTFRAVAGGNVEITSKPYDVSAATIRLQTDRALKPTEIVATGKVRLVSRNPATGQKLIATCDKSVYSKTGNAALGAITLTGSVNAEIYEKGFVGPVIIKGDTASFDFLPNGDLAFSAVGNNGSGTMTGQPVEAAPKGEKP
ncbi:MAG: hypothetical protein H7Y38_12880 [Armatimonadetes bacterium]|nr:hypothetical protein [Armatimonadota bacterium]